MESSAPASSTSPPVGDSSVRNRAQHLVDGVALIDGGDHSVAVDTASIHLRLADLTNRHSEARHRLTDRRLEAIGVARQVAVGVGDRREWPSDVLGERRRHTGRHLAQAVVVVPRQQVLARGPPGQELLGDEVGHHELAQVPQVDRPGGTQTRRDDDRGVGLDHALVDATTVAPQDPLGDLGRPVRLRPRPGSCSGAAGIAHRVVHRTGRLRRYGRGRTVPAGAILALR